MFAIDPQSAHMIEFALDVGAEEIARTIIYAGDHSRSDLAEQLRQQLEDTRQILSDFRGKNSSLRDLATRTARLAEMISRIEAKLDFGENDESIHCQLAATYLETEADLAN